MLKLSYVAYSVLNIRPLNLVLIKKNQKLHSRPQYWNDNEAAPVNGGFVNKANSLQGDPLHVEGPSRSVHCMWEGLQGQ